MISRPPIYRMQYIDKKMREDHYPNCSSMAKECEVSTRSIRRDIDYMRDLLNAPIAYDSKKRGYYYTNPDWSFLLSNILTSKEIDALVMARQVLSTYEGSPFYENVKQALDKIRAYNSSAEVGHMLSAIYAFEEPVARNFDPRMFSLIDDAIRNKLKITIAYPASFENGIARRLFDPYLFYFSHAKKSWYVVGFCNLRQDIRIIGLHLVNDVALTNEHFTLQGDLQVESHIEKVFGKPADRKRYFVELHFSPARANLVYGLRLHPTQQIDIGGSDGSLFLQMEVEDLEPISKWLVQQRTGVKVVYPDELKRMVKTQKRLLESSAESDSTTKSISASVS